MHSCPRCGYDCDCNGDIDDCEVMSATWVQKNCSCDCQYQRESEGRDDDYTDEDNCPACGKGYDEIDYEYQICSHCNHDNDLTKEVSNGSH